MLGTQGAILGAQGDILGAQGGILRAQGATLAAQGATLAAQGATLAARGASLGHVVTRRQILPVLPEIKEVANLSRQTISRKNAVFQIENTDMIYLFTPLDSKTSHLITLNLSTHDSCLSISSVSFFCPFGQ